MKKKNMKTMLTRILACALLVATLGLSLASCAAKDKVKDAAGKAWDTAVDGAKKIVNNANDRLAFEQIDDFGQISLLSLFTGTETVNEQDVMIQVIKATVLPHSAPDKSTTWETYWIDNQTGNEDADVADYVTVLACTAAAPYTEQPGSNYCKITCKQPFRGSTIGVRVTTVVGGYMAECQLTYEGVPSYMNFHLVNEDGTETYIPGETALTTGSTYSVRLILGNALHDVGEQFGQYEVESITYSGEVMYRQMTGEDAMTGFAKMDIVALSKLFADDYAYNGLCPSTFVKAEMIDGELQLTVQSISGYSFKCVGNDFLLKAADGVVFYVTVKDTVSGVSNTLRFTINGVNSVSLSDSDLAF